MPIVKCREALNEHIVCLNLVYQYNIILGKFGRLITKIHITKFVCHVMSDIYRVEISVVPSKKAENVADNFFSNFCQVRIPGFQKRCPQTHLTLNPLLK